MTKSPDLLDLIGRGHDLMARERAMLMRGAYGDAAALGSDKSALLSALEQTITQIRGTEPLRAALKGLISDSRRNERLILAAKDGITAAGRRIEVIIATGRGAVAYERDGSLISSRADQTQKSCRA